MQEFFNDWAQQSKNLRKNILKMIHLAGNGHPGGSLSMVEILFTLMAKNGVMDHSSKKLNTNLRDRLILSKGHGVPALYAMYNFLDYDITNEELMTLRKLNSRLQGHPDKQRIDYMEASTGSLGQGGSIAQGIAMAQKLNKDDYQVFCIIGDGEIQEGQLWEVFLSAPHHKLDNLIVILDYNKGQIDGHVSDVLSLGDIKAKLESFGWSVHEVDGHDYKQLYKALKDSKENMTAPSFIIANTIKGKGVDFMEGQIGWHGKAPSEKELSMSLEQINNKTIGI
jgi:transketolase